MHKELCTQSLWASRKSSCYRKIMSGLESVYGEGCCGCKVKNKDNKMRQVLLMHWWNRAKISVEVIAEIINSFTEPISYKTMVSNLLYILLSL